MAARKQAIRRLKRIRAIQHKQATAAAAAARNDHEASQADVARAREAVRVLGCDEVVAADRFVLGHHQLTHAEDLEHLAGARRATLEQRMREAALARKRADELHTRCEDECSAQTRRAEAREQDDRPAHSPLVT